MADIVIGQLINNNATDENFKPYPNIDKKYGPYTSLSEALSILNKKVRSIGLTFGVKNNTTITEYWFQNGIEDFNATIKIDINKDLNKYLEVIRLDIYNETSISPITTVTATAKNGKFYYNSINKIITYCVNQKHYTDWKVEDDSNPIFKNRELACSNLGVPILSKIYIINNSLYYWNNIDMISLNSSSDIIIQ